MVNVFCSLERERLLLAVKGHAKSVEAGADPVCAACSILVDTLAALLARGEGQGAFYLPPTILLRDGEALLCCAPRGDFFEEYLHDFYMAHIGLSLLSREYPDCVSVECVEERIPQYE